MGGTKKKKTTHKTKNKQEKLDPFIIYRGLTMHLQNASDTSGFEEC